MNSIVKTKNAKSNNDNKIINAILKILIIMTLLYLYYHLLVTETKLIVG